jgi:phage gp29-like protein
MPESFSPVGSNLPPRRDMIVSAAESPLKSDSGGWEDRSINVPRARDRMLEFFEREQLPGDVKQTLAAALNGDLHYQHLLFQAMIDSWPKLQSNIGEIAHEVSVAPWTVVPFALRGEDPTPESEKLAKEIEEIIWRMKPDPRRGENGLEDTIINLVWGFYLGHQVPEIIWYRAKDSMWKPKATKPLPARYYGYPYDEFSEDDPEDRLMLDPSGSIGSRNFVDFPNHRFLIAVNKGHPGHPSVAAPLRALAPYWLAAVYGLKWFMNFTQLYGIPWRHAEVGDSKDDNVVGKMLSEIGSRGYMITRPGTKINILDSPNSGSQLPQQDLVELADDQCDKFILGQTLTSGTDDSGSRALGEVHENTRSKRVHAVSDFVGKILTYQLAPAIVAVNWGEEREDIPEIWVKREEVKDEQKLAERDEKIGITSGKLPVGKAWYYERHGVPVPADGEELLIASPDGAQGDPATGGGKPLHETKAKGEEEQAEEIEGIEENRKPVQAADAGITWKRFPANSGSLGIPRSEMPQIASGNRAAMVNFLKARGIASNEETVQADSLKPTQIEFSPEKVRSAKEYKGGNRAILVSSDDHVVDGHHQWMASVEKGEDIRVIRIMAPIARVLMMAHRMPSTRVAASIREDYADSQPQTVDKLSDSVLENLTGVSREWLSPVRPFFERLAALAMSKNVTDADFLAALEKAQREMPELFDRLNTGALEAAFEDAIGTAMLAGSVKRYEP